MAKPEKVVFKPVYTCLFGGKPHKAHYHVCRGYGLIYCKRHGILVYCTHTIDEKHHSMRQMTDKEYDYLRKITEMRTNGKIREDGR